MISEQDITKTLATVKDPELGFDIVTLGLVRDIRLDAEGAVVLMTLTSPFCPFADKIIEEVESKVQELLPPGQKAGVEITFSPPWEPPEGLREMLGV